jgi:hypothetical protein
MEIFVVFYDLSEEDLLRGMEELKSNVKVLGDLNSTFLALMPKRDNTIIL